MKKKIYAQSNLVNLCEFKLIMLKKYGSIS